MITAQDAFRQRIQEGSRELDERFQMLCMCQEPREPWCNAVSDSSFNRYATRLSMFLKGWESSPFCSREGTDIMEHGLFKGRGYCWQHHPHYAICDACPRSGARWVEEQVIASGELIAQTSKWLCYSCQRDPVKRILSGTDSYQYKMKIGRSNTNHNYPIQGVCQICNGHACADPDCDSSVEGFSHSEHFGLRCATCWEPPYEKIGALFQRNFTGCELIENQSYERSGPDYKEGDPEVEPDYGNYVGEHRMGVVERIIHFCASSSEAQMLDGQPHFRRHGRKHSIWPETWGTVQWRSGNTPTEWDVCDTCKQTVYKSIRRYEERLEKDFELREKEYDLQHAALIKGAKTLRDIRRYLKDKKNGVDVENMQGYS